MQPPPFAIVVPEGVEAGLYANIVSVWHTTTEFTLDFLTQTPSLVDVEMPDGSRVARPKLLAIARVKLPPQQIFELMKALEAQLSAFEKEQQAKKPEQPMFPPFTPDDPETGNNDEDGSSDPA